MKTESQLIDELRSKVTIAIRQVDLAKELGITPQYLHDVLKGQRPLSERVANAMGYERLVIFKEEEWRKGMTVTNLQYIDTLEQRVAALEAEVERLKAPVSDEELIACGWTPQEDNFNEAFAAVIAARANPQNGGSNGR